MPTTTYRNKTTGEWGLTEQSIRLANPQISYPTIFADDNYELVFASPQPTYDPVTQTVQVIAPLFITASGHWEQQWQVVELFPLLADKTAAISANLVQVKLNKIVQLTTSYLTAIQQPVSYTSAGGVTKSFQADTNSVYNLQNTLLGLSKTSTAPTGFYWVSLDNTQVPFTYSDLQGLAQAMFVQSLTAFQHLQTQKNAVNAATTVSSVQSIVW